jgi:hypothetical protein
VRPRLRSSNRSGSPAREPRLIKETAAIWLPSFLFPAGQYAGESINQQTKESKHVPITINI